MRQVTIIDSLRYVYCMGPSCCRDVRRNVMLVDLTKRRCGLHHHFVLGFSEAEIIGVNSAPRKISDP